jgi:hypothetical protein
MVLTGREIKMSRLNYALIVILVIILAAMSYGWYHRDEIARQFVPMPEPEIRIETREKIVERIVYLDPKELDRKDLLPESAKRDKDKEVTAVAVVPEHDGDTTVIAVIDTDTGATTIETRKERPSLFQLSNVKTLGIRYDINKRGTLYGSYGFLRVGNFHAEVYGEIDSEQRAYVGVGIEYRF